ncbi:uncharacterized protein LOC144120891 [Amblyomma americanum]
MTSLVADYGSSASESEEQNAESSESSDEGIEDEQSEKQSTEKTDRRKLPVPSFQSTTVLGSSSSVFSNPFREEEAAQSTILERHVKMTTPVSQQTTINGKQICWNYRKGRCRFGHNCKYVHDSDVVGLSTQEPEPPEPEVVATSAAASSDCTSHKRKNKRPGLSDNLSLSKKAMKFYHKTQGKS